MLAISADDAKTLREFRARYAPGLPFVSDADGRLMKLFGVKVPVLTVAARTTFVIGADRRIVAVQTGGDAIDASGALGAAEACGI